MFHDTHWYYAQGVGDEAAKLPAGWRHRLVRLKETAMTKTEHALIAGRIKRDFVRRTEDK